jgi:glycosyltransferase involved in cell wall biosynthesis
MSDESPHAALEGWQRVEQSRPRVLFALVSFHPGGAERQTIELIRHLDRMLFEPLIVVLDGTGPLRGAVPEDVRVMELAPIAQDHWLSRWLGRLPGCGRLSRWLAYSRLLVDEKIDVVYQRVYNLTLDLSWPTWWRRIPRVSVCVGDQQAEIERYAKIHPWVSWRFARWAYRTADVIAANSNELKDQVARQLHLPAEEMVVLVNGIDIEQITELSRQVIPLPEIVSASTVGHAETLKILTVGRIDEAKGYLDLAQALIDVARQHPAKPLIWSIVGTGPLQDRLLEMAKEFPENLKLFCWGSLSNPFPSYRWADLFILPSHSEGSPNVLLEAMALGCPVISTNCPCGPQEILEGGELGRLVEPHAPAQLAQAMEEFLNDPAPARALSIRAQEHVATKYSIQMATRRLEAILRKLTEDQHT